MLLSSEEAIACCFCCACCCCCCNSATDMLDDDGTALVEGYEEDGETNRDGEEADELSEVKETRDEPEAGACRGEEREEVEDDESVLAVDVGDSVPIMVNESVSLDGSDVDSL